MTEIEIAELFENQYFKSCLLRLFADKKFASNAAESMITAKTVNRIEFGVTGICTLAQRFNKDRQTLLRNYISEVHGDNWFKARDVKKVIEDICKPDFKIIEFDKRDMAWVEIGHVMLKCFRDGMVDKRRGGVS